MNFLGRSNGVFVWGALALLLASTLHIVTSVAQTEGAPALCNSITSGTRNIPQGFASPFDLTVGAHNIPLLSVSCGEKGALIEAGSGSSKQYVYRHGYEWKGGTWRPISFVGDTPQGDWFLGHAKANVSRSESELAGDNYVVAYVCTQGEGGAWKCGCRDEACSSSSWNIQGFSSKTIDRDVASLDTIEDATLPAFHIPDSPVVIGQPSAYAVVKGAPMTFRGIGFAATDNTLVFTPLHAKELGSEVTLSGISGVVSGDETTLSVTPPSNMASGVYRVTVENGNGADLTGTVVAVTDAAAVPPSITSFSPRTGPFGTEVVVVGKGFLPKGNVVATSFRVFEDVASPDGTTLRIAIDPFKESESLMEYRENGAFLPTMDVWFSVMNKNGIAGPAGPFTLQ